MTDIDRRHLFGAVAAGGALALGEAMAAPRILPFSDLKKEADVACLYHCDFGDPARFGQMLVNIGNHYTAAGSNPLEVQLCIVTDGAGVEVFLGNLEGSPWAYDVAGP